MANGIRAQYHVAVYPVVKIFCKTQERNAGLNHFEILCSLHFVRKKRKSCQRDFRK